MAATKHLFLIPIFSLLLTTVFSRSSLPAHSFNTLDIRSTLQQTLHALSFSPQSTGSLDQSKPTTSSSSSSSLSLQLHPRDSLFQPQHKDYKSLTLSRLARDAARVNSLNLKLQRALALDNVKNSVVNEENQTTVVEPEGHSAPLVPGTGEGAGQYFCRVGVGSPAKEFFMVIDTGSNVNWLQCYPCSDCYSQSDPLFEPSESTSYCPLSCHSSRCRSLVSSDCGNGSCLYGIRYGDGSVSFGDFATETVSFGRSGKVKNVAIGCGHVNKGLLAVAAGILGLSPGPLSFPVQIKATSFSYCLVNLHSRSSSTLDFNSTYGTFKKL